MHKWLHIKRVNINILIMVFYSFANVAIGEIRTSVQKFSLHDFLQLLMILQVSQFFKKLLHMERAMSTGRKGWKWHLWMCGPELVHVPFSKSFIGASVCHPSLQIRKTSRRNVGSITAIIVTLFFQDSLPITSLAKVRAAYFMLMFPDRLVFLLARLRILRVRKMPP